MLAGDTIVCFDIGGVLVKIRHTWNEAVTAAQYEPQGQHFVPLNSFLGLLSYQEGALAQSLYLTNLGSWLGLGPEEAEQVHRSVLDSDYPGAADLVVSLKKEGYFTACFSNTNGLHWSVLVDPSHHPAIAALDMRVASHEIGLAKPDLAAFSKVDGMFPPHRRVLFFDDTPENVEAAGQFGWTSYLIDPSADPVAQIRRHIDSEAR